MFYIVLEKLAKYTPTIFAFFELLIKPFARTSHPNQWSKLPSQELYMKILSQYRFVMASFGLLKSRTVKLFPDMRNT